MKQKLLLAITSLQAALLMSPMRAFAEDVTGGGGNAITDSTVFKGAIKLLTDASTALLIISPIICGILIAGFSVAMSVTAETHDKEKWNKNRKVVIITLAWVFGSSAIVAIVTSYFK